MSENPALFSEHMDLKNVNVLFKMWKLQAKTRNKIKHKNLYNYNRAPSTAGPSKHVCLHTRSLGPSGLAPLKYLRQAETQRELHFTKHQV